MSGILYSLAAVGSQFLVTSVLISITCLASIHLYFYLVRRSKKQEDNEEYVLATLQEEISGTEPSEPEDDFSESFSEEDFGTEILTERNGDVIFGRYEKSFLAKLILSSENVKSYYAEIANTLLKYKKVRNRISWANSSFFAGRNVLTKFAIRGKTMYLYFALDPQEFSENRYISDESEVKKYEKVPLRIKIRSKRGVNLAKKLISLLAEKYGLIEAEDGRRAISAEDYPYDIVKNLLKRKLIRLRLSDGRIIYDEEPVEWEGIAKRDTVRAEQAAVLLTDEKAEAAIEEGREFVRARPKGIINIDTLSKNFLANDTVTIASLKEKRLIAKSVNHVKVLARGVLDKPLTVKMPDFSIDAIKMIILTGGKAVKIKTVEE